MFHLTTHACFKALLFLGAGSVICAVHHEQDIWKMGALNKKLSTTWRTFLIGTIALCGVWPLSGFFSKDAILAVAADHSPLLCALGIFVAALTAFYMFRLVFVVFFGPARSEAASHAHESPAVMIWPLRVLAVFTVIGGVIGIEGFIGHMFQPEAAHKTMWVESLLAPFNHNPLTSLFGLFAVLVGVTFAGVCYWNAPHDPLPARLGWLARAMRNRFYFDEFYSALISITHEALSKLADWFDRWIIAGFGVRGVHGTTEIFGRALRMVQTGNLQTYAFFFALGVALVLFFVLK